MPASGETDFSAVMSDPRSLLRIPMGAMSPLWGLFAGVAVSGAAWWWMTRWARPANLEAAFGAVEKTAAEIGAKVEALAAPADQEVEPAPAAAEPVVATLAEVPDMVEALAEPVIEAALEAVDAVAEVASPPPVAPTLQAVTADVVDLEPAAEQTVETVLAATTPKARPRARKAPKPG